ncbi:MAG: bacillithiol biosynthesis cysteine-adding enzyme BshC [Vicinamibacterales bacterium]
MSLQPGLATTARIPIDIRRFPWIRRLAADYAFDYERLTDFFAGDPGAPHAWRQAISRVQAHPRQREQIASILEAQQRQRAAPPAAFAATAQLRNPATVAIVTGQQAGLFGGPLFTLLKALTALRLAERVRAEHQVPAVAIFWIDAEDHDWDEVKGCGVLDSDFAPHAVTVGSPPGGHEGPVARVRLDANIDNAIEEFEHLLPASEFTPGLLAALRRAYRPGTGMVDAFAQWLESVLGPAGLIVYDSSDPAAKPLVGHVFGQEIERTGDTSRLAGEAGAALQARGYHAQVTPHEGTSALFHLGRDRKPVRSDNGRFTIGEAAYTKSELIGLIVRAPQEFSPNVLLRPIVQDTLFPTVCYVAGPNELAYLGQLGRVYESFGVPMPLMFQRATATLLDSNSVRFLLKHEFPLEALRQQDEAALNHLLESHLPPGVDASLEDAARLLKERMEGLAAAVPQIDPTLEGATRATLNRMQDDLKKLHNKIVQAAKRKDETLRRQFTHAQAQAFPGGHPQEREIGFVYFLNRYGPGLIDRLGDELTFDMGIHWVIAI